MGLQLVRAMLENLHALHSARSEVFTADGPKLHSRWESASHRKAVQVNQSLQSQDRSATHQIRTLLSVSLLATLIMQNSG
jgi:hypothetical protein